MKGWTKDEGEIMAEGTAMAMHLMIRNSLRMQKQEHIRDYAKRNPLGHLKEFCTVRLQGPRRIGHTTAMIRVASAMFEKPLYVFLTQERADSEARLHDLPRDRVMGHHSFKKRIRGKRGADAIFVDDASYMDARNLKILFEDALSVFAEQESACIVLIG